VAWGLMRVDQGDPQPTNSPTDVTIAPSCFPAGVAPPLPDSPPAGWNGFVSDVPVADTPPGRCLVLRYGFHRFGAGRGVGDLIPSNPTVGFSGMVWLYSDGRLIVDTQEDVFVQWEHRLTPEGAERIRTAVVDMLGERVGRPNHPDPEKLFYGDGDFYPEDPQALVRLLMDRSWLADEYWVRESATIYRPAWYLVCHTSGGREQDDVEAAVRALPVGARGVLASRAWTAVTSDGVGARVSETPAGCVVVDRADASVLIEALGGDPAGGWAEYAAGLPGERAWEHLDDDLAWDFSVIALMPNGEAGAHGD